MPGMVQTGAQSGTSRRGLRDAFANAYDSMAEQIRTELESVMELGLPSDTDTEYYAYFESAPHPRHWPEGETVAKAGFKAVQFSVVNKDWGLEVEWQANAEADDQLRKVRPRAAQTGTNFALLDHRVFFQMLTGATDPELLPAIPSAPDGAAIFATTAGGAARFGATSGNLLTGTGVASSATIIADVFDAIEQFSLFKDTESQQLFPKSMLDQGYIIYFGAANFRVFSQAFNQNPTPAGVLTSTSNAGVQNEFTAAGIKIEARPTQYITDNDYFIFARGVPWKPFFTQTREPVQEVPFDEMNSKDSARSRLRSMIWHARTGYGVWLPYGVIKVNN